MTEEYLLAWNDHHATFFSAMSDLVTGKRRKKVLSFFFRENPSFISWDKYESLFFVVIVFLSDFS